MCTNINVAKSEAAIMGYGVIFYHVNPDGEEVIGVVWWEGDTCCIRGLKWDIDHV